MFSYLKIDSKERDRIVDILLSYIESSKSKIVITFSLQTLADFAERNENIRPSIIEIIEKVLINGSSAIVSRGKKLTKNLKEI